MVDFTHADLAHVEFPRLKKSTSQRAGVQSYNSYWQEKFQYIMLFIHSGSLYDLWGIKIDNRRPTNAH